MLPTVSNLVLYSIPAFLVLIALETLWPRRHPEHRGYELNYPLLTYVTPAHTGTLPARHSFFSSDADGTVITAIKQAEDSNDLLLRMYEWEGRPATVKLSLPNGTTAGSATDLMEADDASAAPTSIAPYEIKTMRLKVNAPLPHQPGQPPHATRQRASKALPQPAPH